MQAIIKVSGVDKAMSAIAILALVLSSFSFAVPVGATNVDQCNAQFTYERTSDLNDSRVNIDFFNTGSPGNPDSITITADAGYVIVSVQLEVENDNQGGYVTYTGNFPGTFNPSGEKIEKVKVVVKKICTEVCGDSDAENYQAPVAGQTVANNNLCEYPEPKVDVCHVSGNGSGHIVNVSPNGWDGHSGHNGDFLVDGNNPCPPAYVPTPEEQCDTNNGFWNGSECEPVPTCGQNETYNPQTNDCDTNPPSPEEQCDIDNGFWNGSTCETIPECSNDETYNSQTNDCDPNPPTPEELCDANNGFWNGESCETVPTCDENETYNAETNECENNLPQICPEGYTGTYPNCVEEDTTTPEEEACDFLGGSWNGLECAIEELTFCILLETIDQEELGALISFLGYSLSDFDCGNDQENPNPCDNGQVYNEETQMCETPQQPQCPPGTEGTYPDCTPVEDNETPQEDNDDNNNGGSNGKTVSQRCEEEGGHMETFVNSNGDERKRCVKNTGGSGEVLGAQECVEYIKEYIRFGFDNNSAEVEKLQNFLNSFEGANLMLSGIYDDATHAAVHDFQAKYLDKVLSPWGAADSTGFVYHTTKKAINEAYCAFTKEFPLTKEQEEEIARIKNSGR